MKIAVIIGHNSVSTGAKFAGINEYGFWLDFAKQNVDRWRRHAEVKVIRRKHQGRSNAYHSEIREANQKADGWGADLCIELHYDAFKDPRVNGHSTLFSKGNREGEFIAKMMDFHFDEELYNRDRGVKPVDVNGNGGYGLRNIHCPKIITEPFFKSHVEDYLESGMYRTRLETSFDDFFQDITANGF